jgi:type IV pilus assembly protein PilN
MIEINLLPHREARRIADLRQNLLQFVLGLVVIGGAIFFVERELNKGLDESRTSVMQLNAAIEQFTPQQKQVEQFKSKSTNLKKKLNVIDGLEKARTGPVRLFDELAKLTPERLWLNSMKTQGKSISLEGESIDTGVVADFLRSLNESDYFENVDLKKTQGGKDMGGVKLVIFKIVADFKNPTSEQKKG